MTTAPLTRLAQDHAAGRKRGIPSICSAHPVVIEAALLQGRIDGGPVLIEATCNQVNQEGGYTGMTPADFRRFVEAIDDKVGFDRQQLILGGDHLGPNPWKHLRPDEALGRAEVMIDAYLRAGFTKIHLDTSMGCAGETAALADAITAERAARLARASEAAAVGSGFDRPVYIIGTEVPIPGGAMEVVDHLQVTTPAAAMETVEVHRQAFARLGLEAAFERAIGIVVQPGVEFGNANVVFYDRGAARDLSAVLAKMPQFVFEAHSTDYQTPAALAALVRDHYAILKVGPGVTFALREALWALDAIEAETLPSADRAALRAATLARMHAEPANWRKYYHATGAALDFQLDYSLSDRIRYYWPDAEIAAAQEKLFANLRQAPPPLALVSQYLPLAYAAVRAGRATLDPAELAMAHIAATLDAYHGACFPDA